MVEPKIPQFTQNDDVLRVKAFWHAHGLPIVIGAVLGISGIAGFNYWQYYQKLQGEAASDLFEQFQVELTAAENAVTIEPANEPNDADVADSADKPEQTTNEAEPADGAEVADSSDLADLVTDEALETVDETVDELAVISSITQLQTEFAGSIYASLAGLVQAKTLFEQEDYAAAATQLEWVMARADAVGIVHIARTRLAQVYLNLDDAEAVLAIIPEDDMANFEARYYELQGDAYLLRGQDGDAELAKDAYQMSLDAGPSGDSRQWVELKLHNIGAVE